ncbi:hypothetical protein ANO14919_120770 [Xylariales sp. No.14919]|nr:hypothetical protein ANO14919_120770 [Xylariales sp. No.14919]
MQNGGASEPSSKRKRKNNSTARPSNAFILFRSHMHSIIVAENPGIVNADISRKITDIWASKTELEKDKWHEEADELALEHARHQPPGARYKINLKAIEKKQKARAERAAAAKAEAEEMALTQAQAQPQPESEIQQQPEQANNGEPTQEQAEQHEQQSEKQSDQVQAQEQTQEAIELPEQLQLQEPIEFPEHLQRQVDIWEQKAANGEALSFMDILGDDAFNEEFGFY